MKNKISSSTGWVLKVSALVASMMPAISSAANNFGSPAPQAPSGGNALTFDTISGIFCTIIAWVFTLLIMLAVIYVLWAAYLYLTSGGDEEKIKKANHQLFYAGIAMVVAVISRGFPILINQLAGGNTITGC